MLMLTQKQYLDNISKRFKISPISLERATGNSFTRYGFFPLDLANYTRDELVSRRFVSSLKFMKKAGDREPYHLLINWRILWQEGDAVRFYVKGRDFTNGNVRVYHQGTLLSHNDAGLALSGILRRVRFNHQISNFDEHFFYRYRLAFIFTFPDADILGKHVHHQIQDNLPMRLRAWDVNKYLPFELTAATFDHPYYLLALDRDEHILLHDLQSTLYFGSN